MKEKRIIIAGGRDFENYDKLEESVLNIINNNYKNEKIVFVSGCARGADELGERFSSNYGYPTALFPANWQKFGKKAGILRNKEMGIYASENNNGALIAFWDGKSKGTKNMIEVAKKLHLDTYIINY